MARTATKHIMLVEDEALIAMHEQLVLERLGYSVQLALTGEKAVEAFAADGSVDLVLMDIDLGRGIDGTETARILLGNRDVPIVFLSSHTEPAIVEKTENITSYGYISKNSSATVLQASIKMAFRLFEAKTSVIEANRRLGYEPGEPSGKYKLLFDLSPTGIALFDHPTGRFLDANPALMRMLGYERDELLHLTYMDLTPPEFLQISRERVGGLSEASIFETYTKEYIRKDGSRLPISISGVVFLDDSKKLVVLGLIEDITERLEGQKKVAALLADKDLLLKEVHHRIKNNFGVIRSLLRLQAQTVTEGSAAEAFRTTESRVQSMALLYEKLYCSSSFVEVAMGDYLPALTREIVLNFPRGDRIGVVMDVGDFKLEAKRLQPLGILINEVVTNSMKHAFAGRDAGTITVRARKSDRRVSVMIGDDGIGLPDDLNPESSAGFGMTLVSVLAQQLQAELTMERGSGTRFLVEFDA